MSSQQAGTGRRLVTTLADLPDAAGTELGPTDWREMAQERVDAFADVTEDHNYIHALGMPEDCAPLVVFLASETAAGVTGQAAGIGGDRLTMYSHPADAVVEYCDGGWTAEGIAGAWPETMAPAEQPLGVKLPALDLS